MRSLSGKRSINKPFDKLTNTLSSAQCMAYFDTQKDTYITVDASPVGISAVLSQKTEDKDDDKVISYASRALTVVEKRYSQTEKEALAIVCVCGGGGTTFSLVPVWQRIYTHNGS